MSKKQKLIFGIITLLTLVLLTAFSSGTPKTGKVTYVAYIDSAKVLAEHPEMVKVNATLKTKTATLQTELDAKVKNQNKEVQQKLVQEYQSKLDSEKQTLQGEALKKINASIKTIAKQKGYDLVLDSRAVIFGGADITNDVLKAAKAKGTK